MLESIISFFSSTIAGLLDLVTSWFLSLMDLSLSTIASTFPVFETSYTLFQAIGIGLVACIAVVSLVRFFAGALEDHNDTPVRILLRSFVAICAIWWGGYAVELVIDVAKIPYEMFINIESVGNMSLNLSNPSLWGEAGALTVGTSVILAASAIMLFLVFWNCVKLMLEVCERYLVVGVLAFSAPLVFSTISSKETSAIFKKWTSMFVGECIIMTISAWLMKAILSAFAFDATSPNLVLRFLLALALCKVAQRVDTYMQQIGIGVATTGGNITDDILAAGAAFASVGKGSNKTGKTSVLGTGASGSAFRVGGILGGAANLAKGALGGIAAGAKPEAITGALKKDFLSGFSSNKVGDSMIAAGADKAGFKAGFKNALRSNFVGSTQANMAAQAGAAMGIYSEKQDSPKFSNPHPSEIDTLQAAAHDAHSSAENFAKFNRETFGVGSVIKNENGEMLLNEEAMLAGISYNGDNSEVVHNEKAGDDIEKKDGTWTPQKSLDTERLNTFQGDDSVVGDFIGANYTIQGDAKDSFTAAAVETLNSGSSSIGEQIITNPYITGAENKAITGNDELGGAVLNNAFGGIYEATGGEKYMPENVEYKNVQFKTTPSGAREIQFDLYETRNKATGELYDEPIFLENYTLLDEKGRESLDIDDKAAKHYGFTGEMRTTRTAGSDTEWYVLKHINKLSNTKQKKKSKE